MNTQERWTGRHSEKDRLRHRIWSLLESTGQAVGNPWFSIPNYLGAAEAALQLTRVPAWQDARVVKCNPDAAQAPIRLAALQAGKRVYAPVPELVESTPYLLLDPRELQARGVPFEEVMYSSGAAKHGQRCTFREVEPLEFFIVGCVGVTRSGGRTGKGAGFADLELGIFNAYGKVAASTPMATTVHALQVVDDADVVMQGHDAPLDWIATPGELIGTQTTLPRPAAIDWRYVREDQFEAIPFLRELHAELAAAAK